MAWISYEKRLHGILNNFLSSGVSVETVYFSIKQVKKVAFIVFASNSSLCGRYNSNVTRDLANIIDDYSLKIVREKYK